MTNILLLLFCAFAGILFRRYNLLNNEAHKGINAYVLYLALPAVAFKYIPFLQWNTALLFPALSSAIVMAGSYLLMYCYCSAKGYSRKTHSTLELAGGFGNTSFLGFPIVAAYLGEQHLMTAIICDQAMFFLLSTFGIISALNGNRKNKERLNLLSVVKRLGSFPPFIGCLLAIVLSLTVDITPVLPFFDKLAATVAPPALFSVGLQLNIRGWKQYFSQIATTLGYKLIVAPLIVLLIAILFNVQTEIARVSILEAGMPTLVTASVISEQYNLNTKLVNIIVSLGIILGLLSTAFWACIGNVYC